MSRFNPASSGPALDDTINALKGDLTAASATTWLNSWLNNLDGTGPGAQGALLTELSNLKDYISQGDAANIAHTLETLGQLTAKSAETVEDPEFSSKLRRLSEALAAASTALPG